MTRPEPIAARRGTHPAIVRLTHWIAAASVIRMIMSGRQIFNASSILFFSFPAWAVPSPGTSPRCGPCSGAPMKLRMPTEPGCKNPKHIAAITVTNRNPGGYRENQGYNWFGGS